MNTIEFDRKINGKRQAAFLTLYATDSKPWLNYQGISDEKRQRVVPTCVMVNRYDGSMGFVGGFVEHEESLEEAVKREVTEEIGFRISSPLIPVVAYELDNITTHSFALKLPYLELLRIQREALNAPHFGSELTGIFLAHLYDYRGHRGLVNLMGNNLAPSVREEMMHFLLKTEIFSKDELIVLCNRARFDLDLLLQ